MAAVRGKCTNMIWVCILPLYAVDRCPHPLSMNLCAHIGLLYFKDSWDKCITLALHILKTLFLLPSYQFWSPLLMTDEARHSFSLTDQGSVGPRAIILCSAGQKTIACNSIVTMVIWIDVGGKKRNSSTW